MKTFDALSSSPLEKKIFLEASAGTGKTFALEHVFIRILFSNPSMSIENLLTVTFTKSAANELSSRIFNHLQHLEIIFNTKDFSSLPPYFSSIITSDHDRKQVYNKIRQSIKFFDKNHISTIHGFCIRVIKEFYSKKTPPLILQGEDFLLTNEKILNIIRNFLARFELKHILPLSIIKIVFKKYPRNLDIKILESIHSESNDNDSNINEKTFQNIEANIVSCLQKIKSLFPFENHLDLYDEFLLHADHFTDMIHYKNEFEKTALAFYTLNPELLINSPLIKMIKKKVKYSSPQYKYPNLLEVIKSEGLLDLIKQYSNPDYAIKIVSNYIKELFSSENTSSLFSYNDQLTVARDIIKNNKNVSSFFKILYKAILIDEFQDTNLLQWEIFSSLFSSTKFDGYVFLVGDPKQAIYSFRNSDVYVYCKARDFFGEESLFSLNTNYRSSPSLLKGLNVFFSNNPRLFSLSRTKEYISYPPLKPDLEKQDLNFLDDKRHCHFFEEENEKDICSFVIKEIESLTNSNNIPLAEIAVLIKDKHQAERFQKMCPYPIDTTSSRKLTESNAFYLIKILLNAIFSPYSLSILASVLVSPLFGCSLEEIIEKRIVYFDLFASYQKILFSKGLLFLFNFIMSTQASTLFNYPEGEILFEDLIFIVEEITKHTQTYNNYPFILNKISILEDKNSILKKKQNRENNNIQLLTIHAAKGLEFSIVFPIGLIAPLKNKSFHQEEVEEQIRQVYVAFTRASKRLYIPILNSKKTVENKHIMNIFLENVFSKNTRNEFLEQHPSLFSYSFFTKKNHILFPKKEPLILVKPQEIIRTFPNFQKVSSFSNQKKEEVSYTDFPSFHENIFLEKTDLQGRELGILIHNILEKINLHKIKKINSPSDLLTEIETFCSLDKFSLENKELISTLIFNTFNTPIQFPEETFSLKDISPKNIFRECDFLFYKEDSSLNTPYTQGVIDCFFLHNDNFYLIDWKVNFLGLNSDNYSPKKLSEIILKLGYDNQGTIYKEAASLFLDSFKISYPKIFGAFLFLRGLDNSGNGIVHF